MSQVINCCQTLGRSAVLGHARAVLFEAFPLTQAAVTPSHLFLLPTLFLHIVVILSPCHRNSIPDVYMHTQSQYLEQKPPFL